MRADSFGGYLKPVGNICNIGIISSKIVNECMW